MRVANAEMARALRVISVERGLDPREFALVAFGGAGALHACALAEELGMQTVLVPRASGVLSALGLAISDMRRDHARTLLGALDELDRDAVEEAFAALEETARGDLDGPTLRRRADVRYRRQSFELTVAADDLDELAERFHAAHERRYGYRMEDEPVEVVKLRARGHGRRSPKPELPRTSPADGDAARDAARGERRRRVAARRPSCRAPRSAPARARGPGDRRVRRGDLPRRGPAGRAGSTTPARWCWSG